MVYTTGYILCWLLHCVAFFYGVKAWHIGESLFIECSPKSFFQSRLERKFWTVATGTFSNLIFLFTVPLYVISTNFHSDATGNLEAWFIIFHVTSSLVTGIWHYSTYEEMAEKAKT